MDEDRGIRFDHVAELYHTVRNHYHEQLFTDLFTLTNVKKCSDVLEIGTGTGIATLPLAQFGCKVTGIEPGINMARVARKYLESFQDIEIIETRFENWSGEENSFDLVVVATAFHWLDPHTRYQKIASLLREGGYLAIVNYQHITDADETFFTDVQACYEKYMPKADRSSKSSESTMVTVHFSEPIIRSYITEEVYNTRQYIDLLSTYSDHLALEKGVRERLFHCIRSLIDGKYGGFVTKKYKNELILLKKK